MGTVVIISFNVSNGYCWSSLFKWWCFGSIIFVSSASLFLWFNKKIIEWFNYLSDSDFTKPLESVCNLA